MPLQALLPRAVPSCRPAKPVPVCPIWVKASVVAAKALALAPLVPGTGKLPALEDAPGSYVTVMGAG